MLAAPTPRAALLLALGFPVALLPSIADERLASAWLALFLVSIVLVGVDALLALPRRALALEAALPPEVLVGEEGALLLRAAAPGARFPLELQALLETDEDLEPAPPARLAIAAGGAPALASIPLRPRRRGAHSVRAIWLAWTGPLGLARARVREPLGRAVAVLPNVAAARAVAIRFFGTTEHRAGLKVERYIGDGSEFEALREFVPGFDSRSIDWKATARHRKLLCREFRAERNHQLVLALDTGRLMGAPLAARAGAPRVPKLDHAVTAALVLALVALKTGDRVGLFAFDEKVRAALDPAGGMHAFPRIRRATAELAYGAGETNFTLGLTELLAGLSRRSLVVVFTDFVDTVTAELMVENVERLARRHVVLFAALGDPSIAATRDATPRALGDVYRAVVAADLLREREKVLERLRRRGVRCIDARPDALAPELLNRYLDIVRREAVA
jgi:uncharacterized protein (DUF58 family)